MSANIKPTEFEGDGVTAAGVIGNKTAAEKLRLTYRTGQDDDPDAVPDGSSFMDGGLKDPNQKL